MSDYVKWRAAPDSQCRMANFQTLWQHEQGEVYPGPHYRRAYCLLYRATEPELGFRKALPGEQTQLKLTPSEAEPLGDHVLAVERAVLQIAPGDADSSGQEVQQRIIDAWKRRHTGGDPNQPTLLLVGGFMRQREVGILPVHLPAHRVAGPRQGPHHPPAR